MTLPFMSSPAETTDALTQGTLSLKEASERTWPVVVVGAGVTGGMTALTLARAGCAVLLVDRRAFPRYKVCGCCLSGLALEVLEGAGLGEDLTRLGAIPLRRFELHSRQRISRLPLQAGAALSREALDVLLIEAAIRAGAHFLPHVQVEPASLGNESASLANDVRWLSARSVRLDGQTTPAADVRLGAGNVVVATGLTTLRSPLSASEQAGVAATTCPQTEVAPQARIGLGATVPELDLPVPSGAIVMALSRQGYVGLVRNESNTITLAAAIDRELLRQWGRPGPAVRSILQDARLTAPPSLDDAPWEGTPPLTRRTRPVALPRVFFAGDSAGYVEPFTGEGMGWGLHAGRELARLILEQPDGNPAALAARWIERSSAMSRRQQTWCRWVRWGVRAPRVVAWATSALETRPWLARRVLRHIQH